MRDSGEIEQLLDILDLVPEPPGPESRRCSSTAGAEDTTSEPYHNKVVAQMMVDVHAAVGRGAISRATAECVEAILRNELRRPEIRSTYKSGLCQGAVYVASKKCRAPRTVNEIARIFDVPDTVVSAGAQRIQNSGDSKVSAVEVSPAMYLPRFISQCGRKGLDHSAESECLRVIEHSGDLIDEAPAAVAAAAIASHLKQSDKRACCLVSQCTGINIKSIRRIVRLIRTPSPRQ